MHDRQVLNIAFSMTGNPADAQDVYQETFLQAFSNVKDFRGQSSFKTWLLRIAVNRAINFCKKKKRRRLFSLDAGDVEIADRAFIQPASGSNPSDRVLAKEILHHINVGMAVLSAKERAVFTLRHFQEIKIKEIAEMLGCAEGTVKNLLYRATRKMQKALKSYVED